MQRCLCFDEGKDVKAVFTLKAPYENYISLLKGEIAPMQALLTRKIGVQGKMAVLMSNVPRCWTLCAAVEI